MLQAGRGPGLVVARSWGPAAMRAVSLQAEIARVQSIGVPADKIFYSSPCKQVAHIKYAASHGVQLMTFDNEVELSKVARSHPRAREVSGSMAGMGGWSRRWGGGCGVTEGPKMPQHSVALPCRMLLGVAADSSPSAHPSMMFGTTLKSCRHLLETAKEQAVEVVGIRYSTWSFFHRGAQPMLDRATWSFDLPEQCRRPRSHQLLWLGATWGG